MVDPTMRSESTIHPAQNLAMVSCLARRIDGSTSISHETIGLPSMYPTVLAHPKHHLVLKHTRCLAPLDKLS